MEDHISNTPILTDKAKAALRNAGVISQLKQAVYSEDTIKTGDADLLKGKAAAMAENLQQLIDSGTLNDTDSQKLNSILSQLRGALQGGKISREALVMALSEASTAIGTASLTSKSMKEQQKVNQLWQKIEQCNESINDDFEKMQKAGIVFDEKLLEKHKRLLEYLQEHPQDIEKQKELNAVDDQMLKQAESQLAKHPDAKPHFDDAQQKSDDRHQAVDKDLKTVKGRDFELDSNTELDWDISSSKENSTIRIHDVTLDDIKQPNVGQTQRSRTTGIS